VILVWRYHYSIFTVPIPDPDAFFLLADDYRNQIFIADVNFRQVSGVKISPLDRPIGVEYDFVDDRIYWTDFESSVIKRIYRNGSSLETIRNLGQGMKQATICSYGPLKFTLLFVLVATFEP
jgi:hypothetical protein